MAASPKWKVYRDGEYLAACKYAEDAAALAGGRGKGFFLPVLRTRATDSIFRSATIKSS